MNAAEQYWTDLYADAESDGDAERDDGSVVVLILVLSVGIAADEFGGEQCTGAAIVRDVLAKAEAALAGVR